MTIEILESARNDLAEGRRFYERQGGTWLGAYFFDTMFSSIDSLRFYSGLYRIKHGFHWMLTPHFPYSVYYDVDGTTVQIYAIIDNRRDPNWVTNHLSALRS